MLKTAAAYVFIMFVCLIVLPTLITVLFGRFNEGYFTRGMDETVFATDYTDLHGLK
jgi:hypothetical protein